MGLRANSAALASWPASYKILNTLAWPHHWPVCDASWTNDLGQRFLRWPAHFDRPGCRPCLTNFGRCGVGGGLHFEICYSVIMMALEFALLSTWAAVLFINSK